MMIIFVINNIYFGLLFSFWRDGEPNNAGDEDCAHNNAGKNPIKSWNDAPCSAKSFWVCEKAV